MEPLRPRDNALLAGAAASIALSWAVFVAPTLVELVSEHVVWVNANAERDITLYAEVSRGRLPLQGPSTSVGGHHGWLMLWVYGGALAAWRSLHSLTAVTVSLLVATLAAAWQLARRHGSPGAAAVGVALLSGSHLPLFVMFPSHIVALPLATLLTALGLDRLAERRGDRWGAVALSSGLALGVGAHRMGWLLVAAALAVWLASGSRGTRRAWIALPVAILGGVDAFILTLPPGDAGIASARSVEGWLGQISPWTTVSAALFAHVPLGRADVRIALALLTSMVVVLVVRWGHEHLAVRAWAALMLFALFLPHDTQYYFPGLALLPVAVAVAVARARGVERQLLLGSVCAAVVVAHAATRDLLHDGLDAFDARRLTPDLAVADYLSAHGVTEEELHKHTWVDLGTAPPGQPPPVWAPFVLAFARTAAAEQPPRCVAIRPAQDVQNDRGWTSIGAGLVGRIAPAACAGNAAFPEARRWFWSPGAGLAWR